MKKVVIAIPSLATGGAENFARDLALGINRSQYDVYVAITRTWIETDSLNELVSAGVKVIDLSGKHYLSMLNKQIRFFKEIRPDVVHANIGSILHVMLACALTSIPKRLYTIHNEAKLLYWNLFKKLQYIVAFKFFKFVPVAICQTVKQSIIQEFGFSERSVMCVNNGIDVEKFAPQYHSANPKIEIISTGTVYWIKNHRSIISAIENIRPSHPNIHLTILGDGEDRERLQLYITENHLDNIISMPGRCNNVVKYLQKADIYVSASLTEGLPLSILEAMACGLPVIATNAGGTVDIVHNEKNGYVIDKANDVALENALIRMIECSEEQRKTFGQVSRKIAEDWNIGRCVSGYEDIYN